MIKIKVKSVWLGRVAIHQKYISQALNENKGLEIWFEDEFMTIPSERIDEGDKSAETYRDRFNGGQYHLYYFKWNPDQSSLIPYKKELYERGDYTHAGI